MITETLGANAGVSHADVLAALHTASTKTGSDFAYLLATARRESSLNSEAKSGSSSATGLFQFIDQTWLGLVKRFGGRHGLTAFSTAISEQSDGSYAVAAPETKSAILALRRDPEISALMAGEAAGESKKVLECALGREVCSGELYAAHFLGLNGARELISMNERHPDRRADLEFPRAAKANHTIFYNADGSAKTVNEVYTSVVGSSSDDAQQPPLSTRPTMTLADNSRPRGNRAGISHEPIMRNVSFSHNRTPESHQRTQSTFNLARASYRPAIPRSALALSPSILEVLASFAHVLPLSYKHAQA